MISKQLPIAPMTNPRYGTLEIIVTPQIIAPRPVYADGYSTGYEDTANPDEDEEFEEFHQQSLMRNQDEQLEGVSVTVGNLQMQAREMGEELEDQAMYPLWSPN
jgi:hypothetical protein